MKKSTFLLLICLSTTSVLHGLLTVDYKYAALPKNLRVDPSVLKLQPDSPNELSIQSILERVTNLEAPVARENAILNAVRIKGYNALCGMALKAVRSIANNSTLDSILLMGTTSVEDPLQECSFNETYGIYVELNQETPPVGYNAMVLAQLEDLFDQVVKEVGKTGGVNNVPTIYSLVWKAFKTAPSTPARVAYLRNLLTNRFTAAATKNSAYKVTRQDSQFANAEDFRFNNLVPEMNELYGCVYGANSELSKALKKANLQMIVVKDASGLVSITTWLAGSPPGATPTQDAQNSLFDIFTNLSAVEKPETVPGGFDSFLHWLPLNFIGKGATHLKTRFTLFTVLCSLAKRAMTALVTGDQGTMALLSPMFDQVSEIYSTIISADPENLSKSALKQIASMLDPIVQGCTNDQVGPIIEAITATATKLGLVNPASLNASAVEVEVS